MHCKRAKLALIDSFNAVLEVFKAIRLGGTELKNVFEECDSWI